MGVDGSSSQMGSTLCSGIRRPHLLEQPLGITLCFPAKTLYDPIFVSGESPRTSIGDNELYCLVRIGHCDDESVLRFRRSSPSRLSLAQQSVPFFLPYDMLGGT